MNAIKEEGIKNMLLYHGRIGAELVSLASTPMYFYAEGALSSVFAEHSFINGDTTYRQAESAATMADYIDAYLSNHPVVCLFRVNITRPIILDKPQIAAIAKDLGITSNIQKFVEDFEDSIQPERGQVFDWARSHGFNGAVIVDDLTPEFPGGDWFYRPSYIAFDPPTQVVPAYQ